MIRPPSVSSGASAWPSILFSSEPQSFFQKAPGPYSQGLESAGDDGGVWRALGVTLPFILAAAGKAL